MRARKQTQTKPNPSPSLPHQLHHARLVGLREAQVVDALDALDQAEHQLRRAVEARQRELAQAPARLLVTQRRVAKVAAPSRRRPEGQRAEQQHQRAARVDEVAVAARLWVGVLVVVGFFCLLVAA
jgi:hypothetical protein